MSELRTGPFCSRGGAPSEGSGRRIGAGGAQAGVKLKKGTHISPLSLLRAPGLAHHIQTDIFS